MASWSDGYVADIGYTYGFYRELSPNLLHFVSLLKGHRSDLEGLNYCELGCGQGYSANLLAAANPDIQIYATDFNPSQIAGAKALAADAGTTNVHFYDSDFASFKSESTLPRQFDIIALHGIYTWISEENRRHIVDFIAARLKPGGLVYVSYNVLPGWASGSPLRRLMIEAGRSERSTPQRIDAAFALIEKLKSVNAAYFTQNPNAGVRFDRMKTLSRNYIAHEYFNKDWTTFYFADVATELAEAKLSFLGSTHLIDHVDAVNFTQEQIQLLSSYSDPIEREGLRDFLINQQFRRDVFNKGTVALGPIEARERWLDLRFALLTSPADVEMKVKGPLGEATLQEQVYSPLVDAFARGPQTLRQIFANRPDVAELGWSRIQQALAILVGKGDLHPALPVKDESKRQQRTRAFNTAVMRRAEWSSDFGYLASPVVGTGIIVDRFSQLFIVGKSRKLSDSDTVKWVQKLLNDHGQRIMKDGKPIESDEETGVELQRRHAEFATRRMPILQQLGVCS